MLGQVLRNDLSINIWENEPKIAMYVFTQPLRLSKMGHKFYF